MHSEINALELLDRMEKGEQLNVLDVREEMEYHTFNIGGRNVPLQSIGGQIENLIANKNDEIIVVCSAGLRSVTAATLLAERGYKDVKNLTGGLLALQKIKR
ncbi:MAG TPA: rhodanese-like domain-containing protein [Mucilaginibacter sp.]|jgi:adenylyltransferase/sulfurtransferase|nr:rhodanese-like domain-containing protein [Mucilaginibacter sp.]